MGLSQHTNLVLFDGVCNLCNGFVQFLIRNDHKNRFSFSSLQSTTAKQLIGENFQSVVYYRKGQLHSKSNAVLYILKDLGGCWSLSRLFWIVPRFLRDGIYNWIAKKRYSWAGKRDTCMVPDKELQSRFLD